MLKNILVVFALFGSAEAQRERHISSRDMEGLQIAKGFFEGSETVKPQEINQDEMKDCMKYLEHLHKYADRTYRFFKDESRIQQRVKALHEVGHMIDMIYSSRTHCDNLDADWQKLQQISNAWKSFSDQEVTADGPITVDGIDVDDLMQDSIKAFENKDYEKVGYELGQASLKLTNSGYIGFNGNKEQKDYYMNMGTEFASGFMFGLNMGVMGADEGMLFDCIANEEKAAGIFQNAELEIKKAVTQGNHQAAIKGFQDMLRFIFDLATENDGRQQICPLVVSREQFESGKRILDELRHPDTGMQMRGDNFYFNGQDIGDEADAWIDSYAEGKFRRMGFVFAETLLNHSVSKNSKPQIIQ